MAQHEQSAGIIVVYPGKTEPQYLLLHYPHGHWDFIKGHVEKGETLQQTAIREAQEETGLQDLAFIPHFQEKINYFYQKGKQKEKQLVSKEVVFFLALSKTTKITLSHEHTGYAWKPYNEALSQLTFPNAKKILTKANEHVSGM